MSKKEPVRMQIFVDPDVVERIDKLAKSMGSSRNDAAAWLLLNAVTDVDWLVNKAAASIIGAMDRSKGKEKGGDL